ncbi:MAG: hypothetical protein LBV60_26050, partial [Streptomyces sp.]|nr:hypothetical protein [Streptomyces sp.]
MRPRRLLPPAAVTTAALLTLSGCLTVHGERTSKAAVTRPEARRILADFTAQNNRANRSVDPALNREIETGALGAIDQAGLKADRRKSPDGKPDYTPLEFSDSRFLIPKQTGWPKWFVTDTATNRDRNRWFLVFLRTGEQARWKAVYLSILTPGEVPHLARDKDGYVQAVPPGPASRLLVPPRRLSAAYTTYLQSGGTKQAKAFAPGPHTTQWLKERKANERTAQFVTQFQDQPTPEFRPVALRTKDGGALAFFGSRHHARQTVGQGRTFSLSPDLKAMVTGPQPKRSVTVQRVSEQAVLVPKKSAPGNGIEFLNRI